MIVSVGVAVHVSASKKLTYELRLSTGSFSRTTSGHLNRCLSVSREPADVVSNRMLSRFGFDAMFATA
jgi:hypothetical protein